MASVARLESQMQTLPIEAYMGTSIDFVGEIKGARLKLQTDLFFTPAKENLGICEYHRNR